MEGLNPNGFVHGIIVEHGVTGFGGRRMTLDLRANRQKPETVVAVNKKARIEKYRIIVVIVDLCSRRFGNSVVGVSPVWRVSAISMITVEIDDDGLTE
jgi:hypothetical protein